MPTASARSGSKGRAANRATSRTRDSRARTSKRRGPASDRTAWSVLLPLLFGIAVTFGTLRLAVMLTLMGPQAFTLLYPWVALFNGHPIGLSYDNASALGQMLLYLQFPIYGLVAGLTLYSTRRFGRAVIVVLSMHIMGVLLVLLSSLVHPH